MPSRINRDNFRNQETVVTHVNATANATSGTYGNYSSSWIDTDGYDQVAVSFTKDGAEQMSVSVIWSADNTITHGQDWDVKITTKTQDSIIVPTKLRYCKVYLYNLGTASHVVNSWAYLKS